MIKDVLTKISEAIKPVHAILLSVAGIIGIVSGAWVFAEHRGYTKAQKESKVVSYESKIDELLVSDKAKTKQLNRIDSVLVLHFKEGVKQEKNLKVLEDSYIGTLKFTLKRLDDVVTYYEKKAEADKEKSFPIIDTHIEKK